MHLYEIIERTQLMKLMEYIMLEREDVDRNDRRIQDKIEECPHQVNATYHLRLSEEQKVQVQQMCTLIGPEANVQVIIDGLLRIVLR